MFTKEKVFCVCVVLIYRQYLSVFIHYTVIIQKWYIDPVEMGPYRLGPRFKPETDKNQ